MRKALILTTVLLLATACGPTVDEYVYFDHGWVLHWELDCSGIKQAGDNGGVNRQLKTNLTHPQLIRCCGKCVSNERYKILEGYTQNN